MWVGGGGESGRRFTHTHTAQGRQAASPQNTNYPTPRREPAKPAKPKIRHAHMQTTSVTWRRECVPTLEGKGEVLIVDPGFPVLLHIATVVMVAASLALRVRSFQHAHSCTRVLLNRQPRPSIVKLHLREVPLAIQRHPNFHEGTWEQNCRMQQRLN